MTRAWSLATFTVLIIMTAGCSSPDSSAPAAAPAASAAQSALEAQTRRFAPVEITASVDGLPPNEVESLKYMLKAAQVMDLLFFEQVWGGNQAILARLSSDTSPEGRARRHYFMINKGPWSRLDHNNAFLTAEFNVPAKPEQANYYPADATKEEVDKWVSSLKGKDHEQATSFFTVIRRGEDGKFTAVPYNVEYRDKLTQAAEHLRKA